MIVKTQDFDPETRFCDVSAARLVAIDLFFAQCGWQLPVGIHPFSWGLRVLCGFGGRASVTTDPRGYPLGDRREEHSALPPYFVFSNLALGYTLSVRCFGIEVLS